MAVLAQKLEPKTRRRGALGVMYAAEGRATVIMEDNCLFSESGEDLFYKFATDEDRDTVYRGNILVWLDHNNFCVDHALRQNLVRGMKEQQLQLRIERERAESRAREQAELERLSIELEKSRKLRAPRGPVAPPPQLRRPDADLELTPMEEEVLGSMFLGLSEEDPETGLPRTLFEEAGEEEELAPPEEEETPAAAIKPTTRRR